MVPEQHPLRELALFAGAGGGILGGKLLGWRTVCAVEIEPYCREVLMRRQNEGHIDPFPIWDDVRTFDGRPWNGLVDVVSGGFPCQDISVAGRGKGIEGERSGLWKEFARIIGEVRPRFAFVENSPALVRRGLGTVLGDLAALGYDARWGVVSGSYFEDSKVLRERLFILAESGEERQPTGEIQKSEHRKSREGRSSDLSYVSVDCFGNTYPRVPKFAPVGDGLGTELDELAAIGNGQVPIVAATAWRILTSSNHGL